MAWALRRAFRCSMHSGGTPFGRGTAGGLCPVPGGPESPLYGHGAVLRPGRGWVWCPVRRKSATSAWAGTSRSWSDCARRPRSCRGVRSSSATVRWKWSRCRSTAAGPWGMTCSGFPRGCTDAGPRVAGCGCAADRLHTSTTHLARLRFPRRGAPCAGTGNRRLFGHTRRHARTTCASHQQQSHRPGLHS